MLTCFGVEDYLAVLLSRTFQLFCFQRPFTYFVIENNSPVFGVEDNLIVLVLRIIQLKKNIFKEIRLQITKEYTIKTYNL
jgi:hypothetical protein